MGNTYPGLHFDADPRTPEGVRALMEAFTPQERGALQQMFETCRYLGGQLIREAKTGPSLAARAGKLVDIHEGATRMFESNLEVFYKTDEGQRTRAAIACKKGCASCCYMNVETGIIDAIAVVWRLRQQTPDLTQGILATAPTVFGLNPAARALKRVPCALLREDACAIHAMRPLSCRAHHSFNRDECIKAFELEPAQIPVFALPEVFNNMIAGGLNQACGDQGLQDCSVELTAAMALIAADPTVIDRWLAGEHVFQPSRADV